MKKSKIALSLLSIFLLLLGCSDDVANAGSSLLNEEDQIRVKSDTFAVVSALDSCTAIQLTPDSFLLGECETHFGTIRADLLTQLACPEGFEYPNADAAEVDSICLYLYYRNWHGDGNAPLGITVYEMDKATLLPNQPYPSNLSEKEYCSLTNETRITSASHIVVPSVRVDSAYSTESESFVSCVRMRLTDEFADRFFAIRDFSSQEAFNNQFKGLYIRTDFGGSSVLYVNDIIMSVHYHTTLSRPGVEDTVVYDTKSFYVNEEVRQVNRYIYPERNNKLKHYAAVKDTSYIVSPANMYTRLSVCMDSIYQRIEMQLGPSDNYRVYVNRANLTIDVLYSDSSTGRPRDSWDRPASYMMLIKESSFNSFFSKNEMPTDTNAIVATLTATADSLDNKSYSYTYDLSAMLTQQLRTAEKVDSLHFMLVPVAVSANASTGAISSVKQLQTISATYIRSANNPIDPMDIEFVYSGFSKMH